MSVKQQRSFEPQSERSNFIWPKPSVELRPLTEAEIERLETELGKPVDREYLGYWVSRGIADFVMLSSTRKPQEQRRELLRLSRGGRRWLAQITECSADSFLRRSPQFAELVRSVVRLCDEIDALANQLDTVKAGHPRTQVALDVFLDKLIGIAKRANVLPSTPSRAVSPKRAPPAFFGFVDAAIDVATDVVASSALPKSQKDKVVVALNKCSDEALIRRLERLRGRIGDYRQGSFGLVEW
jgi:hypothetical protein